ncbi:hypothetical protein JOC54_003244 [Alkalihalobacillus xiaoxiensis]|uniref:Uncharacterized protein n=1 Tax=Shouchella xiaoxiensis TaxID=766895 RepID=A0ABS2SZR7_9BACI|nr:hypothetical protein [Shouchella xiaoxiensis]MBM7839964.1 hypothetical protein [Shouchella xiaoxiensis]
MYACKVTCRTTLYHDVGENEIDLSSTKAFFEKHFFKTITPILRVTQLSDYKYWKNKFNEIAGTAVVEVLVPYDQRLQYMADYESIACRTVRRLLPTQGAAIQVTSSEWLTPPRKKGFS